jgi:hypothetical protein
MGSLPFLLMLNRKTFLDPFVSLLVTSCVETLRFQHRTVNDRWIHTFKHFSGNRSEEKEIADGETEKINLDG